MLSVSSNGSNGLRRATLTTGRPQPSTFSILERIEWAATPPCPCGSVRRTHFQYPRTDRMGCDGKGLSYRQPDANLSVSSNGSNGLRHFPFSDELNRLNAFSILERIEWAATRNSNYRQATALYFQYPRTDRMGCDSTLSMRQCAPHTLSVSSNGSNGLRRKGSILPPA